MYSLDLINEKINFYKDCLKFYENKPESNEFLNRTLDEIEFLQQIKQDLEIFLFIIKWKNQINLEFDYEYLNEEEIILMESDLKLVNNYLSHHFGYIPKCFK